MRELLPRAVLATGLGIAALASGCAGNSAIQPGKSQVAVYVSMPLSGPSGADGRDVEDAARMALADANGRVGDLKVRAVYLDDSSGARWSAARAGANARRATEDSTAIAYLGDFESGATRTSEPITNAADLLQVSPASTAADLVQPFPGSQELPDIEKAADQRTFGRVIPDDQALDDAAHAWAKKLGVDPKSVSPLGTESTPDSGYAVSAALDPAQLPAAGRRFVDAFKKQYGHEPSRYAAYGHEAMAVILDSIKRAGSEGATRQAVIDAFFDTADRQSILGTYSIDTLGNTSLDRMSGYRLKRGRPETRVALPAG